MTQEENRIEVERGVGWISMKCTLPTATLILELMVKLTWTWKEGRKERTYLKKYENVWLCFFFFTFIFPVQMFQRKWSSNILFARCLPKREIKKVMFIA